MLKRMCVCVRVCVCVCVCVRDGDAVLYSGLVGRDVWWGWWKEDVIGFLQEEERVNSGGEEGEW